MPRKKLEEIEEVEEEVEETIEETDNEEEVAKTTPVISLIEVTFSNGDDNVLRDKINEVIRYING